MLSNSHTHLVVELRWMVWIVYSSQRDVRSRDTSSPTVSEYNHDILHHSIEEEEIDGALDSNRGGFWFKSSLHRP